MKIAGDKDKRYKHGMTNTRLYGIWCNMKTRCYCKTDPHYERWGGRGITICDEWKNDFLAFFDWAVDNGYSEKLTIDRIDNDGNYSPQNCRWVTLKEQANNTRKNHFWKYRNETHTLTEWSEILSIPRTVLKDRLFKLGWDINKAFSTPVLSRNQWSNKKLNKEKAKKRIKRYKSNKWTRDYI